MLTFCSGVYRQYEFYTDKMTPKFDVLVTSWNVCMTEASLLSGFNWHCLVRLDLAVGCGRRIEADRRY